MSLSTYVVRSEIYMSTVVSLATPGMGNRIKTYVSAFSKYDVVKTRKKSDTFIFEGLELSTPEDVLNYPNVDSWRLDVDPDEEKYIDEYKTIDFLYEKTPQYFIDKYLPCFEKLTINKDILSFVDNFTQNWDDSIVGLHIRTYYHPIVKHWYDTSLFDDQISKLNENTKIFFCCDNLDVHNQFLEKYRDRLIIYDRQRYNDVYLAESGFTDDVQINVDAFIEMLLLSRCSTIIGTYISTFTECAWWFSGCKSKVITPIPPKIPTNYIEDHFIKK